MTLQKHILSSNGLLYFTKNTFLLFFILLLTEILEHEEKLLRETGNEIEVMYCVGSVLSIKGILKCL